MSCLGVIWSYTEKVFDKEIACFAVFVGFVYGISLVIIGTFLGAEFLNHLCRNFLSIGFRSLYQIIQSFYRNTEDFKLGFG